MYQPALRFGGNQIWNDTLSLNNFPLPSRIVVRTQLFVFQIVCRYCLKYDISAVMTIFGLLYNLRGRYGWFNVPLVHTASVFLSSLDSFVAEFLLRITYYSFFILSITTESSGLQSKLYDVEFKINSIHRLKQ